MTLLSWTQKHVNGIEVQSGPKIDLSKILFSFPQYQLSFHRFFKTDSAKDVGFSSIRPYLWYHRKIGKSACCEPETAKSVAWRLEKVSLVDKSRFLLHHAWSDESRFLLHHADGRVRICRIPHERFFWCILGLLIFSERHSFARHRFWSRALVYGNNVSLCAPDGVVGRASVVGRALATRAADIVGHFIIRPPKRRPALPL